MLTWFYCSKLTFLHYAIVHKKLTNHTFLNISVTLHKQFIKWFYLQPQIRKSWDSMENANKKESSDF